MLWALPTLSAALNRQAVGQIERATTKLDFRQEAPLDNSLPYQESMPNFDHVHVDSG
jgi:hypothetical protein